MGLRTGHIGLISVVDQGGDLVNAVHKKPLYILVKVQVGEDSKGGRRRLQRPFHVTLLSWSGEEKALRKGLRHFCAVNEAVM